jgi:chitin disaccharide deacetylase
LLIINADDWGGWKSATDAARACFDAGRITSVSAMVFMEDSERAATLAGVIGVDVGLHLNFNQEFTGRNCPVQLAEAHGRIRRFLRRSRYAQLLYNPWLREQFRLVYQAQVEEFCRLYNRAPSHFDGHQHMHLCVNALLGGIIPRGEKVRRSFSFWPGEKSFLNRAYRRWVDRRLECRYVVTRHFFALSQCAGNARMTRVSELAKISPVELMAHPEKPGEQSCLMSHDFGAMMGALKTGTYPELRRRDHRFACACSCSHDAR